MVARPAAFGAGETIVVSTFLQELDLKDETTVYEIGDRADTIYIVISGFVILRQPGPDGGGRDRLIGPGAVFGAADVFCGTVRSTSAHAHGDAHITAYPPEDIFNAMLDQPETADAMVASLLANRQQKTPAPIEESETADHNIVTLMPLNARILDQFGGQALLIKEFPFIIGRKIEKSASEMDLPVSLSLVDKRPYNLSQCHFSIDCEEGQFCVRDYRSYHGTIVNGEKLGSKMASLTAMLQPGENEIIAGAASSPFRFSCLVPHLQAD